MSDALSTSEIKDRSLQGAKWLFLMNGLGMPAAFLISLMLGRVGSESLGAYALAQIIVSVITTFVVYGGKPVLSVFIPKLSSARDRGQFFFSYLVLIAAIMTAVLGFFWLFPKAFEFLLQRKFDMEKYGWFVLLSLVVIAAEALANAASGLMLIKVAAIARQMMRLVLLPLVAFMFVFSREILAEHGILVILGGFFLGYMFSVIVCVQSLARDPRFKIYPGWLLPRGFWAFSLSTMAATIFSFLYGNFDRMAVLSIQDVQGLGLYQAVLSLNMLLQKIPEILLPSVIPTFSNILGASNHMVLKQAFSILCRWIVLPITVASLVMMAFSRELLCFFGREYLDYAYLLTLFGLVSIIRSLSLPTLAIITSMEKNVFRFLQSFLMILAQCALTLLFMSHYGIFAIAGAKMLCVSVASAIGIFYVIYGIGMGEKIPLSYKSALIAGAIMTIFRLWLVPDGWLYATALFLACLMLFVWLARFNIVELKGIFRFCFRHEGDFLKNAVEKES